MEHARSKFILLTSARLSRWTVLLGLLSLLSSPSLAGLLESLGKHMPSEVAIDAQDAIEFSAPQRSNYLRLGYRASIGNEIAFVDRPFRFSSATSASTFFSFPSHSQFSIPRAGHYSDGFVLNDISGSADGRTWNWAYSRDEQIQDDRLRLSNQTSSTRTLSSVTTTKANHLHSLQNDERIVTQAHAPGAEIVFGRKILGERRFSLGIEAGVSFNRLSASRSGISVVPVSFRKQERSQTVSTLSGFDSYQIDSYPLDGVIPPLAPYSGSFQGPNAVVGMNPTSEKVEDPISPITSVSNQRDRLQGESRAVIDSSHEFEADIYSFRIGPYIEATLTDHLSAALGGGVILNFVDAEASYSESIIVPTSGGALNRYGSTSETDLIVGGYLEARLGLRLSERVSVYGSSQLLFSDDFKQTAGTKTVSADFGSTLFLGAGVQIEF